MVRTVWLDGVNFFERAYVDSWLFSGEPHPAPGPAVKSSKVGCLAGDCVYPRAEALDWIEKNRDHAVMVLSDECLVHKFTTYKSTRIVFRNYFQPTWFSKKVYTLPLGFNEGFFSLTAEDMESKEREYSWAFVGQEKGDRSEMLREFESLGSSFTYLTDSFMGEDRIGPQEMFDAYCGSHFVLVPFGNKSPDSFRTMEALKAGSIPVTVLFKGLDHNRFVYGNHPFVVGQNWADARAKVERILADPLALESYHHAVQSWFTEYASELRIDVQRILQGESRRGLSSPQFRLQRLASLNILIQFKYLNHYSPRFRQLTNSSKLLLDQAYRIFARALRTLLRVNPLSQKTGA